MAPSKKNRRKQRLEKSQAQEKEVLSAEESGNHRNDKVVSSCVKGIDDVGNFYNCHADLVKAQEVSRDESYKANAKWWDNGGYGGDTDDMAMTGDSDALVDGAEGLAFLDRVMAANKTPGTKHAVAVDIGAGVGRVTKLILLKRYSEIRLVEGNEAFSKRSRVYLGRKRASRCIFTNCFLQDLNKQSVLEWGAPADLMWCQWALQYLTDKGKQIL